MDNSNIVSLTKALQEEDRALRLLQKVELTSHDIQRLTGFSLRQIQYWRQKGYIVPGRKTEGGYPRFTYREVIRYRLARWLREMGFSVQAIFGDGPEDQKALLPSLEAVLAMRHHRLAEHTLYVLLDRQRGTVLAVLGDPHRTCFHPSQDKRWQSLSFAAIQRQTLAFLHQRAPQLFPPATPPALPATKAAAGA